MVLIEDLGSTLSTLRAALAATSCSARVVGLEAVLGAFAPGARLVVLRGRGRPAPLLGSAHGGAPGGDSRVVLGTVRFPACGCLGPATGACELGVTWARRRAVETLGPLRDEVLRAIRALALHHHVTCPPLEPPHEPPASSALLVVDRLGAPVVVEPEVRRLLTLAPRDGGLLADGVLLAASAAEGGACALLPVDGGGVRIRARSLDDDTAVELQLLTGAPRPPAGLTSREVEVARLVARGATNREVASALGIAGATVKRHLERIYERTGAHGRTELAALVLGGEVPPWVRAATGGRR